MMVRGIRGANYDDHKNRAFHFVKIKCKQQEVEEGDRYL
jgi:hypothetical protein